MFFVSQSLLVPAPSPPPAEPTKALSSANGSEPDSITLHDCLREHTSEEVLDDGNELYCSRCKAHRAVSKVIHFQKVRICRCL